MDEKKAVDKNAELEKILSELNSNIKKDAPHPAEGVSAAEPPRDEKKKPGGKEKANDAPLRRGNRPRSSLLDTATIVDDEEEGQPKSTPVRHIAVTAVEVVDDPPPEKSKPPRPAAEVSLGRETAPMREEPRRERRGPRGRRKPKMSRREKATAVLGFFVSLFVIIGIVSTVIVGVNWTRDLINSTAQKEEFAKFVFPLVIVDVPEFEEPAALDNSAIISSAIWAFIIDDNDKSKYPKDDFGEMTVPDVDIEPYIRKLFGNEIPIVHQTVEGTSVQMNYDAETKSYSIESTPRFLPFTPRVDTISRDKDIYTLQVSYLMPDAVWNLDKTHENAKVGKIYEYRLQKSETGYRIQAVTMLELVGEETPEASSRPMDDELESQPLDEGLDEPRPSSSPAESEPASDANADASEPASSGEESSSGAE